MISQKFIIPCVFFFLSISVVHANGPVLKTSFTPVSCHQADDATLSISLTNITARYTLKIIMQTTKKTIDLPLNNDLELEYDKLPAGIIDIIVYSGNEKITGDQIIIPEPEPLLAGKINIDQTPSDESSCNGILSVDPTGGNQPYTYLWSQNAGSSTEASVSNVCMGIYRCEINDSKNCGPVYISIPLIKNALQRTE